MKKDALLFIAMASVFSLSCLAQRIDHFPDGAKMENMQLLANSMSDNDFAVVSYHVEERINMAFGSSITTYEVSNLSLVGTNDLGQNNTRIVTPKYARAKAKAIAVKELPMVPNAIMAPVIKPLKVIAVDARPKYVNIDILSTYERVLDKGYKTVEMLKRVGNGRYFDGDLAMAAKWYSQLFDLTTDLDAEYYYRYAQSLHSIRQIEKANEMMKIFENKK